MTRSMTHASPAQKGPPGKKTGGAGVDPDHLLSDALTITSFNKKLGITPRTVTLDKGPTGLPGEKDLSIATATATVLGYPQAAPIGKVLEVDQPKLKALLGQYRAFTSGYTTYQRMRQGALDWELVVESTEALARTLVAQAVDRLAQGSDMSEADKQRLQKRWQRLKDMMAEQLSPEQLRRDATLRRKADTQGQVQKLDQHRQLLLTMAAVREGGIKNVALAELLQAAHLYAELTAQDEEVTGQ